MTARSSGSGRSLRVRGPAAGIPESRPRGRRTADQGFVCGMIKTETGLGVPRGRLQDADLRVSSRTTSVFPPSTLNDSGVLGKKAETQTVPKDEPNRVIKRNLISTKKTRGKYGRALSESSAGGLPWQVAVNYAYGERPTDK